MLNLKERRQVLAFLRYSYCFNLCPTRVDTQTWKLRRGIGTKKTAWICYISYGSFLAHVSYKLLALAYSLFVLPSVPLHQILIHAVIAVVGVMNSFFYYAIHFNHADVNASFVRMTLTGDLTGGEYKDSGQ